MGSCTCLKSISNTNSEIVFYDMKSLSPISITDEIKVKNLIKKDKEISISNHIQILHEYLKSNMNSHIQYIDYILYSQKKDCDIYYIDNRYYIFNIFNCELYLNDHSTLINRVNHLSQLNFQQKNAVPDNNQIKIDSHIIKFLIKSYLSILNNDIVYINHPFTWSSIENCEQKEIFLSEKEENFSLKLALKRQVFSSEIDKIERLGEVIQCLVLLHSKGIFLNKLDYNHIQYSKVYRKMSIELSDDFYMSDESIEDLVLLSENMNIRNNKETILNLFKYNRKNNENPYDNYCIDNKLNNKNNDEENFSYIFTSPEVLLSEKTFNYFHTNDIWGLGILSSIIFSDYSSINISKKDIMECYIQKKIPSIFNKSLENIYIKSFVESILLFDSFSRPDIFQIGIAFNNIVKNIYPEYSKTITIKMTSSEYDSFINYSKLNRNQLVINKINGMK